MSKSTPPSDWLAQIAHACLGAELAAELARWRMARTARKAQGGQR